MVTTATAIVLRIYTTGDWNKHDVSLDLQHSIHSCHSAVCLLPKYLASRQSYNVPYTIDSVARELCYRYYLYALRPRSSIALALSVVNQSTTVKRLSKRTAQSSQMMILPADSSLPPVVGLFDDWPQFRLHVTCTSFLLLFSGPQIHWILGSNVSS